MEKKRILVADDDKKDSKLLEDCLLQQGYEVILAHDGQEALDKTMGCNPHLIVMDILLPRINGWKVCSEIKQNPHYKHIPVVMSSSMYENYDQPNEDKAGDVYINKPVNLDLLLSTIRKLLNE